MGSTISIKKGYDIKLKGAPARSIRSLNPANIISVKPGDFAKVKPKLMVGQGDSIQAGQTLFVDKLRPELRFASPASGEIAEIILGKKRRIVEIRILTDKDQTRYLEFPKNNPSNLSRSSLIDQLIESGCWNYIRQRPYSVIANPADTPKSIFISCFDSSPLAPDLNFIVAQEPENFKTGIQALQVLANGQLHAGLPAGGENSPVTTLLSGANIHYFKGPHPAGNVGIQIHHIDPIQKGEVVWYVHPQDVMIIGRLFSEGRYRADRIVALTGQVDNPEYAWVKTGQRVSDILELNGDAKNLRIIQGNVLHGSTSAAEDGISVYTNQITVIPEGREPEFLGWLLPGFGKLSLSRTFFSWLTPKRKYMLNTNNHGELRAFVMTGQYDKVLPMDIYPVFLLKAILAGDIEKMEALGIYEVAEEDFALCEFVCTSKIEVQKIIAQGLDLMQKEG